LNAIAQADSDGDHAVTVDEWVDLFYKLGMDEAQFESVVVERGQTIMQLFDRDHDSHISLEDWRLFFRTVGVPEADYQTAFQKLDRSGNGYLTFDEITAAGREARGNWLYGDYTAYL